MTSKKEEETIKAEPKIDMNKYEDFLFELDDNFFEKGKTFLSTSADHCIKVEMKSDEKDSVPCFATIQMDDVHTLVINSI